MIIGLLFMVVAWSLLFAGSQSPVLIAVEFGGVALFMAGHVIRMRRRRCEQASEGTESVLIQT